MRTRKAFALRLDPAVYQALRRWAGDELRSVNARIGFLLRRAHRDARRLGPREQVREQVPDTFGQTHLARHT